MAPILGAGLIGAGGSLLGGALSAFGAGSAAKAAQKAQDQAYGQAVSTIQGYAGDSAAFGTKPDPTAFLYNPVDITQSQLDTIAGNLKALPSALELVGKVNPSIWANDLQRIRTLVPQFDAARDSYMGTTRMLQEGRLPFSDVMDILGNSAGLGAAMGAPGGNRALSMRDLGQTRLSAMQQGNSMFQNMIQIAEAISPVSAQMRPQSMFLTPSERLQADIMQRALEQQGNASAALAEAMPDPAANATANAMIGLQMARFGAAGSVGGGGLGLQALGGAIGQGAGAFAQYYAMNALRSPMQSAATMPIAGGFGASRGLMIHGSPMETTGAII